MAEAAPKADLRALNPATNEHFGPSFPEPSAAQIEAACAAAAAAFDIYRETDLETRAAFLEAIAAEIEALGDELIQTAMAETGLPQARITGERGRTCGQLRLFAQVVRRGDWIGARIDPALPERTPLPRADLRQRFIPLGPVVVFGASNFPLAFSTGGGDTASALAAGCPVIVKGHSAHPNTGAMVGSAIDKAIKTAGLPAGVFSILIGQQRTLGAGLVADPRVKAVGFTGSRAGGVAFMRIAAERREPIPVFAEMSSINPVVLMPAALAARAEALGTAFVGSLTMGAGQFCTNPGLIFALEGPDLDRFEAAAVAALTVAPPHVMLTPGIFGAYEQGVNQLLDRDGVKLLARGCVGDGVNQAVGALFSVDAETFQRDEVLSHEVFGSSSLIVRVKDAAQLATVLESLEGQLTATLQMDPADVEAARPLLPILERKAGRVLANGWPTGVEVSHAMVHGGPFPATSDPRSTSVGTRAIERFLRPVCYQDIPDALLPAALKADNPLGVRRAIDGVL
ncbi:MULTISPECIES: aldehyde dehydrogenase (NADP(+)) [Caulobacter]|jgi:NADP-dependent aldehyde dehydrogenase|uniref:NADP-dependent aldehyde dehydrogenase n=1 Tax=Caulobacter rhizosphaerae TaxID=2010972 RepID=A0ABU1N576_9CAUL|nr:MULTISPECIES: aldehyde dehydrogenase (NADP(+)) [Caulobacter]KQZ32290.1 2,5-dioxovalerate dehydrogenase [Caulobacter sp. Root1472]MDR6533604.1 NADP-dependent aldehyde dehydrogenase [Caulobacter rhizosphaerae]GGL41109.1 2,5-dioxovalerate dehydrogenase [Caulobacter rhizosphaerae]